MSDWRGDPTATVCIGGGFSDEQRGQVLSAIEEWRAVSDGRVTLPVQMPCELHIEGVADLATGALGDSFYDYIRIGVDPVDGPASLRVTALHELGHFLTGDEHSSRAEDVMFPRYQVGQWNLTENDIARLH